MKKNSKIHFWIETELKNSIEKKAKEKELSVSEYCREIIKDNFKFAKLEIILEKMIFLLENRKIYKGVRINNSNTYCTE